MDPLTDPPTPKNGKDNNVLMIIELVGALVLIGLCGYGAYKFALSWLARNSNPKDPN